MESPLKTSFQTYEPPNLSDGWNIADPASQNIDGEILKQIYEDVHNNEDLWQIRSLLVFRNNNLVAESYMKDSIDRIKPAAIWSATKQITAILTGIAVDKNLIYVSDPISEYLPQTQNTNKAMITIENLLMMQSGINFNNDGFNGETNQLLNEKPSNSLNFILDLGMRATHGTEYYYNDGDPQIVSAILQEQTGKSMLDWADEVLFDTLEIENLEWFVYKDGITMGAFGILTTPRELAKIGQLVLNDGEWNGEQIVSTAWLDEMTRPKNAEPDFGSNISMGYYWHYETQRNLFMMLGHGGQCVFVNKAKNLIVVITAEPNTQGDFILSPEDGLAIYDRINAITN
jgi:CubicO group peptidase (beta-lactamase class C family)